MIGCDTCNAAKKGVERGWDFFVKVVKGLGLEGGGMGRALDSIVPAHDEELSLTSSLGLKKRDYPLDAPIRGLACRSHR